MRKGNHTTLTIAEKTHVLVDNLVKIAMIESGRQVRNSANTVYVGAMGCLAAAMAIAPIIAKKPEGTDDLDIEACTKIIAAMTNHETVMFAALVSVYTMQDLSEEEQLHSAFSPSILWLALQAWSKIFPERLADNYFDPGMLNAARVAGKHVSEPLDVFLQDRITHRDSPGTLN